MTRINKNYQSKIIFFVWMALICFMIFCFGNQKVLAATDGEANLSLWTLGEINNAGEATLTDYQIDNSLKDIVIPTAVDFIQSDPSRYGNLKKVYITRTIMNKAAENGDKEGGSLKISDTGANDSNFDVDKTKVFAEGADWSDTFSGNRNSFGGFTINYIESIDLSNFDTSNVTDMSGMFFGCSGLTSLDVSNFDTSNVTNMSYMFESCSSLESLDLSSFDTRNVTGMSCMFYSCSRLTSLDLSNFDTSNVTNMDWMFYGCSGLTNLDLSSFDTRNVTGMSCMFYRCSRLTSLDLSNFDTSNVTNMDCMFYGCSGLTSLDLSSFNTSKVTNMSYMFEECSSLESLDLSSFDTGKVTNIYGMFCNCCGLTGLDLSGFNLENLDRNNLYDKIFAIDGEEERQEPLLITTNDKFLTELTTLKNNCQNRTLFTTTLKVDGENVKFKGGDESEFVKYNGNKTEKYINLYESFTTTDSKEEILQKLSDRLEEEKKNLIVVPGYENLEWEPEKDTEGKVSYSLQNVYTIKKIPDEDKEKEDGKIEPEEKNYSWGTIENSGGSSTSLPNQNLISKNESTNIKTEAPIKSKIPEKLQTRKYLSGYPDKKIKPENYVTNAEFVTVIYRLINNGEKINYDKLKDIGVKKSDWFSDAVAYLIDDQRKIINVMGEKFDSNKNITGYEMLNIIHNVLKFYDADNKNLIDEQNLNSNVTRTEMAKVIFETFDRKNNPGQKKYSDLDKKHWAYKFLMDASE